MAINNSDRESYEAARAKFSDYLRTAGLRRTPERFAVLSEIYAIRGHFDIDTLYRRMHNRRLYVSRATIYNTIKHLTSCRLVKKHRFGMKEVMYERSYDCSQHDHVVMLDTGTVFEFCDPQIQSIKEHIEKHFNIKIHSHSLTFFAYSKDYLEDPSLLMQRFDSNIDDISEEPIAPLKD